MNVLVAGATGARSIEIDLRSLEPKGATQEARFSSYCRLLPPRPIAKLLEGNG